MKTLIFWIDFVLGSSSLRFGTELMFFICMCPSPLLLVLFLYRCMWRQTSAMTHLTIYMCHAESSACPSKRETSFTLPARMTPTGGRRTGTDMRTGSPSLVLYLVRTISRVPSEYRTETEKNACKSIEKII